MQLISSSANPPRAALPAGTHEAIHSALSCLWALTCCSAELFEPGCGATYFPTALLHNQQAWREPASQPLVKAVRSAVAYRLNWQTFNCLESNVSPQGGDKLYTASSPHAGSIRVCRRAAQLAPDAAGCVRLPTAAAGAQPRRPGSGGGTAAALLAAATPVVHSSPPAGASGDCMPDCRGAILVVWSCC